MKVIRYSTPVVNEKFPSQSIYREISKVVKCAVEEEL